MAIPSRPAPKKVVWTENAEQALGDITDRIADDNPSAALRLIKKCRNRAGKLGAFLSMGRKVPEYDSEIYRELIEDNYRIIYRYNEDEERIEILSVYEGHRLLPSSAGDLG